MKKILFILLLFSLRANAVTYFVAAAGSDANNGTSSSTPWQTITKVNAAALNPGDQVLFNRGDLFYGALVVSHSGSAGNFITYGAYGTGALPIITGLSTMSTWVSDGGGIYEDSCGACNPFLNMVTFQDTLQPMGRWPRLGTANGGYMKIDSSIANTEIVSSSLFGALNYVGGEVVSRSANWILDRGRILTQPAGDSMVTIKEFPYPGVYNYVKNSGFFIQNHVNTCTNIGDWAYDSTSKKLKMYFGGSPASYVVQASTIDYLVTTTNQSYIIFDHIFFKGSNSRTIDLTPANHIQINNCNLKFAGIDAINAANSATNNIIVNNDSITYTNSDGISNFHNGLTWTVTNCYFRNTGMVRGAGGNGDGTYETISYINGTVQNCVVINTGYLAVHFQGDSCYIHNNLLDSFCSIKSDCGAVYSYNETTKVNRRVIGNIIINGTTDNNGEAFPINQASGVYMDGGPGASHVIIDSNTVANTNYAAFQMNANENNDISYNTTYNCGQSGDKTAGGGSLLMADQGESGNPFNMNIKHNIFVAIDSSQNLLYISFQSHTPPFTTLGTMDSNYYCRPIWEPSGISTAGYGSGNYWNGGGIANTFDHVNFQLFKSLDKWQGTYSGQDAHSQKSPKTITNPGDMIFLYNATQSPTTTPLSFLYEDMTGAQFNGTITLQPYTSAVLLKVGGIQDTNLFIIHGNYLFK